MSAVQSKASNPSDGRACRIKATAQCLGRETPAAVLELSSRSIQIYLRADIGAEVGRPIAVSTEELGMLSGTVAWTRLPYVGVEVTRSSNTSAQVSSYFKAFG
ncbi:PilZ domain-containing protein [Pararhizobium mangrovi]|uniref:PilZ domain-containing protein n=1 Tax=Pararhizobium mangrovi TaxID=2590452 RepID=A0A506TWC4_9HYPH|nr:PilZ domain-containing protein [Pararhizobium mangrovi]TPW26373.1 PilZ domain-containing protein [Pararhizobium mangrovi]